MTIIEEIMTWTIFNLPDPLQQSEETSRWSQFRPRFARALESDQQARAQDQGLQARPNNATVKVRNIFFLKYHVLFASFIRLIIYQRVSNDWVKENNIYIFELRHSTTLQIHKYTKIRETFSFI